jgi:hypothetical protein
LVHRTVIRRCAPLAAHGWSKEPIPLELAGQSWCGSGGGALAVAEGTAEGAAEGVAGALALAAGASGLGSSLEQPKAKVAIEKATIARTVAGSVVAVNRSRLL